MLCSESILVWMWVTLYFRFWLAVVRSISASFSSFIGSSSSRYRYCCSRSFMISSSSSESMVLGGSVSFISRPCPEPFRLLFVLLKSGDITELLSSWSDCSESSILPYFALRPEPLIILDLSLVEVLLYLRDIKFECPFFDSFLA